MRQRLRNLRRGNLRLTDLHRSDTAVSAYAFARSLFARLGLQVVVKSFYSPIPDLKALSAETWERRSDLAGVRFDPESQLELLYELEMYLHEFDPPRRKLTAHGYYRENPSYGTGDADVLYAMTRRFQPECIVELGSGFTTLVLAQALRENGAGKLRVYDPYPGVVGSQTPGVGELQPMPAQEVPLGVFAELESDDFLVVDTTHTVKTGGDVNRIILDVLPRLAPGVLVHFHDIFLPYEYPREWPERFGLFWSEQYLLQAFLAMNRDYEVVCALHTLFREHPRLLHELIPALREGGAPAAFWIRRAGTHTSS